MAEPSALMRIRVSGSGTLLSGTKIFTPASCLAAQFKKTRPPHSAPYAHGHQAVTAIAPLEFVQDRHGQFCPGGSERMAQSNGPAVDIDPLARQRALADDGQRLAGECFVEFDDI